jgi:hypothetical protein
MSDNQKPTHEVAGAAPPGGGQQTHETMQAEASAVVTGPASTPTLAAGGGLEVPGREPHPYAVTNETLTHEPIPGERDPATLTHREPGAMGTPFGAELPPSDPRALLTDDGVDELHRDGGGHSHRRQR